MSYQTSHSVFDNTRFRADVIAYIDRWHLSARDLAYASDLGERAVQKFLRGDRGLSLLVACALAETCDLSLDSYRIAS